MIRPVRRSDLPAVLGLVRELAAYEFAPGAVEATEDDLRRALFAEHPAVFAHVAVEPPDDGARDGARPAGAHPLVVGVAVWYLTFSTWTGRHGIHLVDLVVSERARGRGHGLALFEELVRICGERDYARLDWEVLDTLRDRADRRAPHEFYLRRGGSPRQGWSAWRMDAAAIRRHRPD